MFNRNSLLIVMAALAAGLGLWAAQVAFSERQAMAAPAPMPALDPASLAAVRLFSSPRVLPDFNLEQSDGSALTQAELRGRWTLVFLGFTHCPDVCPTTLSELAQAQAAWAALDAAVRPRVLFVSVDPARDSAVKTGEYAAYFHPDTLAATAQEPALQAFASSLGLVYMKVESSDGDYTMDHSTPLVLLDPEGRQVGLIRPPFVAADIAADLALLAKVAP